MATYTSSRSMQKVTCCFVGVPPLFVSFCFWTTSSEISLSTSPVSVTRCGLDTRGVYLYRNKTKQAHKPPGHCKPANRHGRRRSFCCPHATPAEKLSLIVAYTRRRVASGSVHPTTTGPGRLSLQERAREREERMRPQLGLAMVVAAALVLVALLSSSAEVSAVRVPAAPLADQTSNSRRGASSSPAAAAEQPRKPPVGDNAAAASSARLDASSWKQAAAAGGSSPPSSSSSTVFDPDRMSKRRVRRGSDPIHNKC